MIQIGQNREQKVQAVKAYLGEHPELTNIVYFGPNGEPPLDLSKTGLEIENRTWDDVIMYKYFYPLLEHINHNYLIVFDEMMRVKNRSDLTYNCCHHYGNQTNHILVFNYLPVIDEASDYMILVDLAYPNKYKGISFDGTFLDMSYVPVLPEVEIVKTESESIRGKYEEKKEALFDGLGNKDPDTIPRELHVWAGTQSRKQAIKADGFFIARNARFKKPNVYTYKDFPEANEYTVLDFPLRQLTFNDFLRKSGVKKLHLTTSGLPVDDYYCGEYRKWEQMIKEVFYGVAPGIQTQKCSHSGT